MTEKCDVVEFLKFELQFLEDGGYGRSPHQPGVQPLAFLDSPTCLNFDDPTRPHPCRECFLMQFVPPDRQSASIPCHFIPLDERGETLNSLYRRGNQLEIEEKLGDWLRKTIAAAGGPSR